MKQFLFAVIMVVLCMSLMNAQEPTIHKAGDKSVLFTWQGFDNMAVSPVNGGAGMSFFLANHFFIRGTLGFQIEDSKSDNPQKSAGLSFATLFNLSSTKNTMLYLGPTIGFTHEQPNYNQYTVGGILGAEVMIMDNVSLSGEYVLTVDQYVQSNLTYWTFGKTAGRLILSVRV